jgi:hypothetical protein
VFTAGNVSSGVEDHLALANRSMCGPNTSNLRSPLGEADHLDVVVGGELRYRLAEPQPGIAGEGIEVPG